MEQTQNTNPYSLYNLLKVSAIIGLMVLSLDLILLALGKSIPMQGNSFWINAKYLILAISDYYAMVWFFKQRPQTTYFGLVAYSIVLAMFVAQFDIFYYLLYTQVINPAAKQALIQSILDNPSLQSMKVTLQVQLSSYFSYFLAMSTFLGYVTLFGFYGIFYALFIKFLLKK